MTLIDTFKEPCTLYERKRVPDGEGGWTVTWTPSLTFDAAIVLDSSMNARMAEQEGVTALYTVTTEPNVTLEFHDAFKCGKKTFRITKVNDSTPQVATFQFNQYQAEEWELTT